MSLNGRVIPTPAAAAVATVPATAAAAAAAESFVGGQAVACGGHRVRVNSMHRTPFSWLPSFVLPPTP